MRLLVVGNRMMLTRTSKGESLLLLALEVLGLGMELSLKLEVSERILEVCVYVTNQFSLLLLDLRRSVNKQIRMIRVKERTCFLSLASCSFSWALAYWSITTY